MHPSHLSDAAFDPNLLCPLSLLVCFRYSFQYASFPDQPCEVQYISVIGSAASVVASILFGRYLVHYPTVRIHACAACAACLALPCGNGVWISLTRHIAAAAAVDSHPDVAVGRRVVAALTADDGHPRLHWAGPREQLHAGWTFRRRSVQHVCRLRVCSFKMLDCSALTACQRSLCFATAPHNGACRPDKAARVGCGRCRWWRGGRTAWPSWAAVLETRRDRFSHALGREL